MAKDKKFWGVFDTRLLIWFHYMPLLLIIFGTAVFMGMPWQFITWKVAVISYLAVSIGDQLIHATLGAD